MKKYISSANTTPKFEIIRDDEGAVSAYHLGNWYLCKIYHWGNTFTWYIFKTHEIYLYQGDKRRHAVADGYDEGYVHSFKEGKQILIDRYIKEHNQDNVTATTTEYEYSPDYYYQIMNLLDSVALAGRKLTSAEKKKLDDLRAKDGAEIEDMADANDCYTENDALCSTWDEMVVALRGLFEQGVRG